MEGQQGDRRGESPGLLVQENEQREEGGQRRSSPRSWGEVHPGLAWRGSGEGWRREVRRHQRRRQQKRRRKEDMGVCCTSSQVVCVYRKVVGSPWLMVSLVVCGCELGM